VTQEGPGRIRFGPEVFRFQERGGVGRYVIELHRALLARGEDSGIVAGLHRSAMLDGVPAVQGRSIAGLRPDAARQALSLVVDRALARRERARLGRDDVWHPSYYDVIPRGSSLLAVTVYDMVHERYPDEMSPRDRTLAHKAAACRAADVVLCISATTAADLQDHLALPPDRIAVTHLGVTTARSDGSPPPFRDRPFVLYVGDRRPRYKQWTLVLDALRDLPSDLALLCVGAPPAPSDHRAIEQRGLGGRVRFESADDARLATRYDQALALVYPSRYEGFGLPPLEALAHGCPVVAAATGAIPEVVGDVALLVEPTLAGVGAGMSAALEDAPEIARQRAEGPAHAARFTWASTAAATLAAYERALS
jgi:glycosyltransferase involved in cell wall biosynthesis